MRRMVTQPKKHGVPDTPVQASKIFTVINGESLSADPRAVSAATRSFSLVQNSNGQLRIDSNCVNTSPTEDSNGLNVTANLASVCMPAKTIFGYSTGTNGNQRTTFLTAIPKGSLLMDNPGPAREFLECAKTLGKGVKITKVTSPVDEGITLVVAYTGPKVPDLT